MRKIKWMGRGDLPEKVRVALDAFQAAFNYSNGKYKVVHVREDALFIQIYADVSPYSVARFVNNNPDLYCEIEPVAFRYTNFRIFFSDWMKQNEAPRSQRWLKAKCENVPFEFNFMIKNETP